MKMKSWEIKLAVALVLFSTKRGTFCKKLARYWLSYLVHLKKNYPYLFSLAVRSNPFDKNSSPLFA